MSSALDPALRQQLIGHLQQAVGLHRGGRLAEAAALYRRVLEHVPDQVDALNLLGTIEMAQGRAAAAAELIQRALRSRGPFAEGETNLGAALGALGRKEEAEAAYRRALALQPTLATALNNLGQLLATSDRDEEAEGLLRQAVAAEPGYFEAVCNLADLLVARERWDEAEALYVQAEALRPSQARVLFGRGNVARGRKDLPAAEAFFQQSLLEKPDYVPALNNLGTVLMEQHRPQEAEEIFRQAYALQPNLHIKSNIGLALRGLGRILDAAAAFREILAVEPDDLEALSNLAGTHYTMGGIEEAVAICRRVLEHDPVHDRALTDLLLLMNYRLAYSPDELALEHRKAGMAWDRPIDRRARPFAMRRDPNRRLRIGYVSGDFRKHSCWWFIEPLLRSHDRGAVSVLCYSNSLHADRRTGKARILADVWRNIHGLSDEDAAALIEADGVDILVDLSGHTGGHRLKLFGLKPAPIQVSWLGYPNTTGLGTMDYRITDAWADPPGPADARYTERLFRLPRPFLCYAAPVPPPPPELMPGGGGPVSFGCFQGLHKYDPAMLGAWGRILRAVPESRLKLKTLAFMEGDMRRSVRDRLEAAGVPVDRVDFLSKDMETADHLERYRQVDIVLDTLPYAGTATTCEAMWMGAPVVTWAGDAHVRRVGASLLSAVGLDDLVAGSLDGYVETAVRLAGDDARRREIRATLTQRMAESALCDRFGFAAAMEAAYRSMWRQWIEEQAVNEPPALASAS